MYDQQRRCAGVPFIFSSLDFASYKVFSINLYGFLSSTFCNRVFSGVAYVLGLAKSFSLLTAVVFTFVFYYCNYYSLI